MSIELSLEGSTSDKCFDFVVRRDGRAVPATFWNGAGSKAKRPPLVLLQHGGPFHKRHERSDWLAETVVAAIGAAVLLIEGPIHGRRRADDPGIEAMLSEFERHWRESPGIDDMVADWRLAIDAVLAQGWADAERIAWFGTSMGTAYGIPLCAFEPRIKGAALGMWGTDWGQEAALLDHAHLVTAPTLFQIKDADEIFVVEGQRQIFDALGSRNKCLHTFSGGHSLTAPGQLDQLLDFLARVLADLGDTSQTGGRAVA